MSCSGGGPPVLLVYAYALVLWWQNPVVLTLLRLLFLDRILIAIPPFWYSSFQRKEDYEIGNLVNQKQR